MHFPFVSLATVCACAMLPTTHQFCGQRGRGFCDLVDSGTCKAEGEGDFGQLWPDGDRRESRFHLGTLQTGKIPSPHLGDGHDEKGVRHTTAHAAHFKRRISAKSLQRRFLPLWNQAIAQSNASLRRVSARCQTVWFSTRGTAPLVVSLARTPTRPPRK